MCAVSQLQCGFKRSFISCNHFIWRYHPYPSPQVNGGQPPAAHGSERLECSAARIEKSGPEKYDCNVNEPKSSPLSD